MNCMQSGLFSGGNATIFDLLNDANTYGAVDIFTYLQGKVAGLRLLRWDRRRLYPGGDLRHHFISTKCRWMPIQLKILISVIWPWSKYFHPVLHRSWAAGPAVSLRYIQKRGGTRRPDPSIKGLEMTRIAGYNLVREFYSPDYLINPEPET